MTIFALVYDPSSLKGLKWIRFPYNKKKSSKHYWFVSCGALLRWVLLSFYVDHSFFLSVVFSSIELRPKICRWTKLLLSQHVLSRWKRWTLCTGSAAVTRVVSACGKWNRKTIIEIWLYFTVWTTNGRTRTYQPTTEMRWFLGAVRLSIGSPLPSEGAPIE